MATPEESAPKKKQAKTRDCGHVCPHCNKAYDHNVIECHAHTKRVCDDCWGRYRQGFLHKNWIGHRMGIR